MDVCLNFKVHRDETDWLGSGLFCGQA